MGSQQSVEKVIFMLRQAQHEWKVINHFKASAVRPEPFNIRAVRPELVEGNGWLAQDRAVEG